MIVTRQIFLTIVFVLASFTHAQINTGQPILSEFLPDPTGDMESEWIELFNPNTDSVQLAGYMIGDSRKLYEIADTLLYLPPGEYIVLTWDVDRFLRYYAGFDGLVISPSGGWPALNNDGDVIRLADNMDAVFDSVVYDEVFGDNRSWERFIDNRGQSFWGGSFSLSGSTPGGPNSFFLPRTASIDLSVIPDPFSPNGDGFEDRTTIRINPPEAESLELAIYDISGRKVKSFFEGGVSIPGDIIWDGRDDFGENLPVGIYIIYAKVEGGNSMSTKKTVVIAR